MENSNIKGRVFTQIERLISFSCPNQKMPQKLENLHIDILKKYYNATDVSIDYHRRRVKMNIIMDDDAYDPNKVNTHMPTLYVNLLFKNLCDFLKSCIDTDNKSLPFYAGLLQSYENKDSSLIPA